MKEIFKGLDLSDEAQKTLTERIESAKDKWIDGAKNDAAFVKKIKDAEAGKFFNSMEKVLKRNLDINMDDLKEDLSGLKKQEALLKMGIKAFETGKDKTNQDLQDELIAAKAELKELKDEGIPALLEKENKKHYQRYVNEGIMKDTLGVETTCNERARVSIVNSFLQEKKLKASWDDESQEYQILTKDNLKFTKDDKPLTNKEIVKLALEDGGVLKQSKGKPDKDKDKVIERPAGTLSANAEKQLASFQK